MARASSARAATACARSDERSAAASSSHVGAFARRGPPQRGHDGGRRLGAEPSCDPCRPFARATAASAAASCAARRADDTLHPFRATSAECPRRWPLPRPRRRRGAEVVVLGGFGAGSYPPRSSGRRRVQQHRRMRHAAREEQRPFRRRPSANEAAAPARRRATSSRRRRRRTATRATQLREPRRVPRELARREDVVGVEPRHDVARAQLQPEI